MSLIIANDCGPILYYARQYVRAIEQCEAVLKNGPGSKRQLATRAISSSSPKLSRANSRKPLRNKSAKYGSTDHPWVWAMKAYAYGRWGQKEEFQRALKQFLQRSPQLTEQTPALLFAYVSGPDKKKILDLLEEAYQERSPALTNSKS
jgi:tetratricopeptide (TPR) repeat protein